MAESDRSSHACQSLLAGAPSNGRVFLEKLRRRFFDRRGCLSDADYHAWLKAHGVEEHDFIGRHDPALVAETESFARRQYAYGAELLSSLPFTMGGGAAIRVLYLLTRLCQPQTIVETGVASGYSSAAFLTALQANGGGSLHSSDFPYFRIANARDYIGMVVPPELKSGWDLRLEGDSVNLPAILRDCGTINLFHYDSDKSYTGRGKAMAMIMPRLAPGAIILMDDIQDNCFFHDFAMAHPDMRCDVVHRRGKYIGILNLPAMTN